MLNLAIAVSIVLALAGIALYMVATLARNIACEINRKGLHDEPR